MTDSKSTYIGWGVEISKTETGIVKITRNLPSGELHHIYFDSLTLTHLLDWLDEQGYLKAYMHDKNYKPDP